MQACFRSQTRLLDSLRDMKAGVPGWSKRMRTPLSIVTENGKKKTYDPESDENIALLQDILGSISERFMEVEVCKYLKSPVPRVPYWCMSPIVKRVVWMIDRINKELQAKAYLDNAAKSEKPDHKTVAKYKDEYNKARKYTGDQAEAWQRYDEHLTAVTHWNIKMISPFLAIAEGNG